MMRMGLAASSCHDTVFWKRLMSIMAPPAMSSVIWVLKALLASRKPKQRSSSPRSISK